VVDGFFFSGRQKAAVKPLKNLRANWLATLAQVREYRSCGLCDLTTPPLVPTHVSSLYEAKMWSQLFYDSIVPFDTKSIAEIKRAGYPAPDKNFLAMNHDLFADLRRLSDMHTLAIPDLRKLDSPALVDPQLQNLVGGQPLSRVIDKIFYRPRVQHN
jgi:hypothetical protein